MSVGPSPRPLPVLSDGDLARVVDLARRHAGMHFDADKRGLLTTRLARRAAAVTDGDLGEYVRVVQRGGPEVGRFIEALATHLTRFYREPSHFADLAAHVRGRGVAGPPLRGWCAGCSTGEEAYTAALTLADRPAGLAGAKVLATDLSPRVLETAAAGEYAAAALAEVPERLRRAHFRPAGRGRLVASEALRRAVVVRRLNLADPLPFGGPLDFVFCRNVMLYLDRHVRRRLVGRIVDVLAPGGLLFIGHSETLSNVPHPLTALRPSVYAKPAMPDVSVAA